MTIGEVAGRAGLNTSHIRYYERVGVLPEPQRTSGQRRYGDEVLHRLAIIDVAQRAGLTLDEIRYLTGPDNQGARAGDRIRELAERKLPDIEALISRAEAVKAWLEVVRLQQRRRLQPLHRPVARPTAVARQAGRPRAVDRYRSSGGPTNSIPCCRAAPASASACSGVGGPCGLGSPGRSAWRLSARTKRSKSPAAVTSSQRAPSRDSTR